MKKKLLSLALALAVCLSLTVPALADIDASSNGESGTSGEGWALSAEEGNSVLRLSGAKNLSIWMHGDCVIELAPGTKSTLLAPVCLEDPNSDGSAPTLTFRGSGELEIISNGNGNDFMTDYYFQQGGALSGCFSEVKLENGLEVIGGMKQGDRFPLSIGPKFDTHDDGWYLWGYTYNGKPAQYVHIGPASPAASAQPAAPGASGGFTDVPANSPYKDAIAWAVEKDITKGKTATTFGPGDTCTVSHILTFLWRANGRPGAGSDERAAVAAWAQGLGIDTGNLSTPCTRSMAVLYMWKAAGSPAPAKTASFADVPAGADYAKAVSWAVEKGITNGIGGDTFSPGGTCTRGQIVTFLYRAQA